jgi:hypothetical protein
VTEAELVDLAQRGTFVCRDVIGLVALDFVLWIIGGCVVGMALVVEVVGVYFDNTAGHFARLRIPTPMVACLELNFHCASPRTVSGAAVTST